jgi:tol-pal system protein YbgF
MSSVREDNRRLTQTVTELRTDRRMQDRKLRDLQHQLDELKAHGVDSGVPVLPVEVASPAVTVGAAAPPADAPRVVGVADDGTEIVYEGDAAAGRAAAPVSLDADGEVATPAPAPRRPVAATRAAALPLLEVPTATDRIEVTRHVPPLSSISARAATRTKTRDREPPTDRGGGGEAGDDYRAAVELVKSARYEDALVALRAFVVKYPRHDYADNAQYWVGEAYYAQKDFARGLVEFRRVIEVYPRGNKVPDALLKVGYCYQALGQADKARAVLEQVVSLYPKSEPATLAAKRLGAP